MPQIVAVQGNNSQEVLSWEFAGSKSREQQTGHPEEATRDLRPRSSDRVRRN
jgi:hypothetical protein